MTDAQAGRVLRALSDAEESIRVLSHLTGPVLAAPDRLSTAFSKDVMDAIRHYRVVVQGKGPRDGVNHRDVLAATAGLLRAMRGTPHVHAKLEALCAVRSPAMLQVVQLFEQLLDNCRTHLSTTVEEDRNVMERFEVAKMREEKALSEKAQLQQRLKLDRIQRRKQLQQVQLTEDGLRAEIDCIQRGHQATMDCERDRLGSARNGTDEAHAALVVQLERDIGAAEKELERLREAHAAVEKADLKAMGKCEMEVEAAIREYDEAVGAAHDELTAEQARLADLLEQSETMAEETRVMTQDRIVYELDRETKRRERQRHALHEFVQKRAAQVIQSNWRRYVTAKKKSKKGGKKGKKKK